MRSAVFLFFAASSLTGCGVAYISSTVNAETAEAEVDVVALNASTVQRENQLNTYRPRQLPAAFDATAGVYSGGGAGAAVPLGYLDQQVPTQPQTRLPPTVAVPTYTIGIGDVIVLATRQGGSTVEELTGLLAAQNRRQGYTVQDDGAIAIPDVGRIVVSGMTLEAAEQTVFQRLVERQIDPTFSLEVAEFNSKRVTVGGAVATPATVPIRLSPLTLTEALTAAGGVSAPDVDYASVRLYRDGVLYQIPLAELYSDQALQRTPLLDGDSLFVDTTYEIDQAAAYFEQQLRLADEQRSNQSQAIARLQAEVALRRSELDEQRSNFERQLDLEAVDRDYVYLAGEVTRQSRYPLPFGTRATLADALFGGGGFPNETGNPAQIYVLRSTEAGTIRALHLDGSNAVNLVLATKLQLMPDDVIFVAEQPVTRWNRVVQQIVPSLITTSVAAATN